jgi:L-alanine-DL-glutamate epimerase-like enolase superfamily enzyme
MRTDSGITGIGEACGARSAEAVAAVIQAAAPLVRGCDIFEITRTMRRLCHTGNWSGQRRFGNQAFAGIEMALLDICGKVTGQPVANLLGGRVRDEISWFGFVQGYDPAAVASHAMQLKERGYEVLYLKVGLDDERDVAAVRSVRDAVGEGTTLRVDANEAWDRLHAVKMIRRLDEYEIEWVEQPLV